MVTGDSAATAAAIRRPDELRSPPPRRRVWSEHGHRASAASLADVRFDRVSSVQITSRSSTPPRPNGIRLPAELVTIGQICPTLCRCEGTSSSDEFSATPGIGASGSSGGPDLGKGSHGILILGDRRTVVRNPEDELKTGTLHAMLKQLGLSREDI